MSTITDIYDRYRIPYQVTDARGGWIHTHCPFCAGSAGFHLGYNLARNSYTCWRCGFHLTVDVLMRVCSVDRPTALELYRSIAPPNSGGNGTARLVRDRAAQKRVNNSRYRHPDDVGPMRPNHRRYLERRGFDPDLIEREWGVLGTGPVSSLDDVDYRHRLLIPINWDGEEISFQTRDVTGKSDVKYLACPPDREVRSHKHVLYGRQDRWGDVGIVVEGVTDAWRLGPLACATFGTGYATEQVVELSKRFRRLAIVFDPERAAQERARRLAASLRIRLGTEPVVVDIGSGDPGSMSQDDADHLVGELTS